MVNHVCSCYVRQCTYLRILIQIRSCLLKAAFFSFHFFNQGLEINVEIGHHKFNYCPLHFLSFRICHLGHLQMNWTHPVL